MNVKKIIIIVTTIILITVIIIISFIVTPQPPEESSHLNNTISNQTPIVDPIGQNVLDYQIEEKPTPQLADPNDGYPRQLILNQFNHLPNGNIEIKIQTDLKHTNDKKANCRLVLNGQDYSIEKVEISKQFASCKPLVIHESDIKSGTNTYEVFYQASDYKDRYAGEITKR